LGGYRREHRGDRPEIPVGVKLSGWITVLLQVLQLTGAVQLTPEQHQAATAALLALAGIFLGFGIEKARRNNPQPRIGGGR